MVAYVVPQHRSGMEGMAMAKRDVHVVPHKDGWATRREGAERVSRTFGTQRAAEDSGRVTAQRERVELVTHRRDGTVRDSDSYGRDPFPSRDRKH
jgi:hypothetical protein